MSMEKRAHACLLPAIQPSSSRNPPGFDLRGIRVASGWSLRGIRVGSKDHLVVFGSGQKEL